MKIPITIETHFVMSQVIICQCWGHRWMWTWTRVFLIQFLNTKVTLALDATNSMTMSSSDQSIVLQGKGEDKGDQVQVGLFGLKEKEPKP